VFKVHKVRQVDKVRKDSKVLKEVLKEPKVR
jgi:hypothetical protein